MEALIATALVHTLMVLDKARGTDTVDLDWTLHSRRFGNDIKAAYARLHLDTEGMWDIRAVRTLALVTGRSIPDMKKVHDKILDTYAPETFYVCDPDGQRMYAFGSVRLARAVTQDLSEINHMPFTLESERVWHEDRVLDTYDGCIFTKGTA